MNYERSACKGANILNSQDTANSDPVVIKKYANRRLYNTATSAYVTLDDLAQMVKDGDDFVVFDAKSGDDITRTVLTQIIFEEESKGQNLLPINFLRQLIRFYGDSMQAFVPSYLEFSLESLAQEQERFRQQLMDLGGEPFKNMEEQAKRNMALFQQAMQMFNPFAGAGEQTDTARKQDPAAKGEAVAPAKTADQSDELSALRKQMSALQDQLETLANKKS
ncbi:MAG: polyhydroxyalkanoate synthesis repressor PhaR [Aestuariivirgaceae bacterium]